MKHIKHIALCLALLQLLLLLAACTGNEAKTTVAPTVTTTGKPSNTTTAPLTNSPATTKQTTEKTTTAPTPPPEETSKTLCLVRDGEALYKIVTPLGITTELTEIVRAFADEFEDMTGAALTIIPDTYEPDGSAEIVIGQCLSREDTNAIVFDTAYTEQRLEVAGEHIAVAAYANAKYEKLFRYFLEAIYEEDGSWYVDEEILYVSQNTHSARDLPKYATANGYLQGGEFYLSMQDTLTVTYEHTNAEEFAAYEASLLSQGYAKHTDNTLGKLAFATYTKGNDAVQLQYAPHLERTTINFLRNQYIPAAKATAFVEETRASANFLKRFGPAGNPGWGLSMILQLGDGTYVVIDGGKSDTTDRNNMVKFMQDNKPASHEKPIVSLWILTHPHEDHVEMFVYNAQYFSQHVDLKILGYNIPLEPCSETDANGHYFSSYYHDAVERQRAEHFPDAVLWTMHSGQKLYLADAEIDVLYTHEDYFPQYIYSANDCNTSVRITIDGASMQIFGDNHQCNTELYDMYTDSLRAEIVQIAHHGTFGSKAIYQAVDAKVVYWPCSAAAAKDCMDMGMHKNWVNTQWTRTENGQTVRGDRQHYNAAQTAKIYFDEL